MVDILSEELQNYLRILKEPQSQLVSLVGILGVDNIGY